MVKVLKKVKKILGKPETVKTWLDIGLTVLSNVIKAIHYFSK